MKHLIAQAKSLKTTQWLAVALFLLTPGSLLLLPLVALVRFWTSRDETAYSKNI